MVDDAHGGLDERVYATEAYVKEYKAMLDQETYYVVEHPVVNDTVKSVFIAALHAVKRFKYFFTAPWPSTEELNYPGIEDDRSNISSLVADFLVSTDSALNNVCAPFGHEACGFFPDNLHPERAFTMKELVGNVTQQTDSLRKVVDSGVYAGADDQFSGIERYCDVIIPKPWPYTRNERSDPLEYLVARGCDSVAADPKATKEIIKLREDFSEYAKTHDLGGGDDNRNLPNGWTSDQPFVANETLKLVVGVRDSMELSDKFSLNDTLPWTYPTLHEDMNQTAKDVLARMQNELDSKGWAGRQDLHKKIVEGTVLHTKLLKKHPRYAFNALAYLPYKGDVQQCRLFPRNNFVDVGYRNLNYFVLYANGISRNFSENVWNATEDRQGARGAVLDHAFAKGNDNLCARVATALKDNHVNTTAFGGIAAVRCGYEFVWYELGYTYFYAAHSSTDYTWEKKGGAYDANAKCGQIFFFP